MTEKKANEILRTKYPNATIYKKDSFGGVPGSRIVVVFEKGGKVYPYSSTSYQYVLNKLGFNVLYKYNVEDIKKEINELEEDIKRGHSGYNIFLKKEIEYTKEEIDNKKEQIKELQNMLDTAIVV